jgi:hypothetical protein
MEDKEAGPALRLFDRDRTAHPWAEAFAEMEHLDEGRRWAAAANWRMDPRVSEERESGDLNASGYFDSVAHADDWWRAQGLYFRRQICRTSEPASGEEGSAYCRETNEGNKISTRIPGFDQLVHVGSFNGMLRRIMARSEAVADVEIGFREVVGRGLPAASGAGPATFNRQVSELAEALAEQGKEAVQSAAGLSAWMDRHPEPMS